MISAILNIIAALTTGLQHAWDAYNSSDMVKAKQAQMSQDELDQHRALIQQAMTGTPQQKQDALSKLRDLTAE